MASPQWQSIKDFSPGIHATISPNHAPGTASPEGTFGCFSPSRGVLAPLPKMVDAIIPPTPAVYPASGILDTQYHIVGLHSVGPAVGSSGNTAGTDLNQTEVYLAIAYTVNNASNDNRYLGWYRYKRNLDTPAWATIKSEARAIGGNFSASSEPQAAEMVSLRTHSSDPSTVGAIVTAFCSVGTLFMFPDQDTPTTDSTEWLLADKVADADFASIPVGGTNICGHQGRLVYFYLTTNGAGANSIWATNEQFFWSKVNSIGELSTLLAAAGGKFNITAQFADPTGYEVIASLTADELLLIKSRGGAIVMRGDLDDPTIVTYPYVRSPGNSNNRGTPTPLGYAYPVDGSGVWVWTGGQVSEHLTPHLDPDFWRPALTDVAGAAVDFSNWNTQCAQAGDFVLFPNNWIWDTNSAAKETGWWRIDDPTVRTIHRWNTDWRGIKFYGTPSGFVTTSDDAIFEYDVTTPRDTFQWTSQPLANTLETEVRLDAMVVVADGVGTVTVRAFTGEDPVGQTVDFPIDGTGQAPVFSRQLISVLGTELSFEVASTATDSADPAPTIHELRYSLQPSNRITTQT